MPRNYTPMHHTSNTDLCPICAGLYTLVEESLSVCIDHELWYVVRCRTCWKTSFSIQPSVCMHCLAQRNEEIRSLYFTALRYQRVQFDPAHPL